MYDLKRESNNVIYIISFITLTFHKPQMLLEQKQKINCFNFFQSLIYLLISQHVAQYDTQRF